MYVCVQPNVKPQPEEDGGESVSSPTMTTTGVSNVQVGPSLAPCPSLRPLPFPLPSYYTLFSPLPLYMLYVLEVASSVLTKGCQVPFEGCEACSEVLSFRLHVLPLPHSSTDLPVA